jgi:hypothetical protein
LIIYIHKNVLINNIIKKKHNPLIKININNIIISYLSIIPYLSII